MRKLAEVYVLLKYHQKLNRELKNNISICVHVTCVGWRRRRRALQRDVLNRIGDIKVLGSCALVSRALPRARAARRLRLYPRRLRHPDDPPPSSSSAVPGSPPHQALAAGAARSCTSRASWSAASPRARPDPVPRHGGRLLALRATARTRRGRLPAVHHSRSEVLRSAAAPPHRASTDDGVLLKWKADFGSTLNSCVILGASSVSSKPSTGPWSGGGKGDALLLAVETCCWL